MHFESEGKIVYFNTWAIVECSKMLMDYYRYFIWKETGVKISPPKFGAHISFIRGEAIDKTLKPLLWKKHHDKVFSFQYSHVLETNNDHWWLSAKSDFLSELRKEMGLSDEPPFGFHLTIGRQNN
jgi:hypothetical protein